jgi:hypothetical protein
MKGKLLFVVLLLCSCRRAFYKLWQCQFDWFCGAGETKMYRELINLYHLFNTPSLGLFRKKSFSNRPNNSEGIGMTVIIEIFLAIPPTVGHEDIGIGYVAKQGEFIATWLTNNL